MTVSETVKGQLNNVIWKAVYHSGNGVKPEEIGWEEFIATHQSVAQFEYGLAKDLANSDKAVLEGLPLHKQKLGGAIIRAMLTNEEIEEYGRKEV